MAARVASSIANACLRNVRKRRQEREKAELAIRDLLERNPKGWGAGEMTALLMQWSGRAMDARILILVREHPNPFKLLRLLYQAKESVEIGPDMRIESDFPAEKFRHDMRIALSFCGLGAVAVIVGSLTALLPGLQLPSLIVFASGIVVVFVGEFLTRELRAAYLLLRGRPWRAMSSRSTTR